MKDSNKTKRQLIQELEEARKEKSRGKAERDSAETNLNISTEPLSYQRDAELIHLVRKAIDSTADAIALSDYEGRHIYHNKAFIDLFEYTVEDMQAAGGPAIFAVGRIASEVFGSIMGGVSWVGEVEVRAKSGREFSVYLHADAIKDDGGNVIGLVQVFTDITERKSLEYQLKKKHDELQLILDSIPAYVFYKDKDGRMLNINKSAAELASVSREKLLNKTVLELVPDAADQYNKDNMEVLASGEAKTNIEEPLNLPDGMRWLKTDKLPIKDDIGNVIGLVGFSVDITARKKAEEALRESEEKLRVMFESMTDAVVLADMNAKVLDINSSAVKMFGYSREEAIGRNGLDLLALEHKEDAAKKMAAYIYGDEIIDPQEYKIIDKNGRAVNCEIVVNKLSDKSGKPYGFVVVVRDITERRKAEEALRESEAKYRVLTDKMTDIIWTMDMNLQTTFVSPSITRILGYTPEERLVQPVKDQLTPESYERVVKILSVELERDGAEGVDPDRSVMIDVEYYRKDGSTVWMENVVSAMRDERGKPVMLHGVSRDISEHKKAEEALRESEQKLRWMFESIKEGIFIVGTDGRVLEANAGVEKITGYSRDQLLGQSGLDYIFPGFKGDAMGMLNKTIVRGGTRGEIIVPMKTATGKDIDVEATSSTLYDSSGNPIGLIGIFRDVSERKRVENALKESEEKLRLMFASMADGVVVTDVEGRIIDANETQMRMFGFENKSELIGKGGFDFLAERERGKALADMFKVYEEGFNTGSTYTVVDRNGREFECELSTALLHDAAGKPSGTVTVMRDVTERRRMEQTIKENEERYRLLAENSLDAIWTLDMSLKYTFISPAILQIVSGYTLEEFSQMSIQDVLAPESFSRAVKLIEEEMAGEVREGIDPYRSRTVELELINKDGSTVWTEVRASFLRDAEGNIIGIQGTTRDVTERRKAEKQIRESEERYRLLAENVSDVIWTMDLNFNFTYVSPSVLHLRGYTTEEAKKLSLHETLTPDSMEVATQILKEEFDVDHSDKYLSRTVELELRCKDGSTVWTEVKISWMYDANRNRIGIMGVTRDITERRKMEEALRETGEKLRVIFDSIGEAVTVVDLNGDIVDANLEALRLHGFNSKEKIIGRKSLELVAAFDRERAVGDAVKSLKESSSGRNEYKLIDATGREFDGEFNIAAIRGEGGKPAGFIGVARDISERKSMEEVLKKSEEYFKAITENSSDIIVITEKDGNIKYCSRSVERYSGYSPEELVGSSAFRFIHPDDVQQAAIAFNEALSTKDIAIPNEFRIVHKDGSVRVFGGLGKSLFDNPAVNGFIMNIHDVTESRWAEEALRNSEEKLRVTFDSMMDSVVVSDSNLNIVDVNRTALGVLGVKTKEEIIGRNVMDVIRLKENEAALSNLSKMLIEDNPQVRVEYGIALPDGREMDVEVSTAMIHDVSGGVVGFVNVIRDVSERRKWEDALRQSEEKYRNLVEREKDVIVSVDALGFVKTANSAVKSWGYTVDEVLKMNFMELIAPEWREVTATELQSRLLQSGEHVGQTMVIVKNGEIKPIEYTAVVIEENGEYAGAQAIVRDISERKRAEEALEAKERYFRAITDLSSGAALVVDREGIILDVTGGLERISGHTREGTVGRPAIEFIHPEDMEKSVAALKECLGNPGKTIGFEARLKNSSGEWQWTESLLTNLLDHNDVRGIVDHLVDITERKKAEEDIKDHARRIEALYSIAQVISQSTTLDKMLKDSLDKVCDTMDTESGCIFMLNLDENCLKLKACKGIPENIKHEFSSIELTEQGIERMMQVQDPVIDFDETRTVADVARTREMTDELERKSIAAAPLFRGEELQGFLVVFSSKERSFSSEDLGLFKAIANEISLGMNTLTLLEQTRAMSVTDELTGLYNRRYFFEMLDVEINRASRTNHPFSVVMIDLDGFKEYNDKYGHSNGDTVLEKFAHTLMSSIRKSDMAFRYGGDEFALILSGADSERARKIVQRMRARWQKAPLKQAGIAQGNVGFSSGIAEYPANAESADGLVFLSDAALYQAKRKGYEDKLVSELRTLSTNIIDVATQDQVYALAATVDARDPYTYGHSQRVADTALRIGRAIGLAAEDLERLHAAALLHDIGKVGVPDAILTKPGKPSSEEWDVIRKHCAEGARILGYVKEMSPLVPIVLHHHEWYDGSGYPAGLKGLEIPPGARITSVADAYDTMVTKRPYRNPITTREACEELKRSAGTQFDPVIVEIWCKLVAEEEQGR